MTEEEKKKEQEKKTNFQGPVSLEAILAATSGKKTEESKKEIPRPVAEEEEIILDPKDSVVEKEVPNSAPKETSIETEAYKTASKLIRMGMLEDFDIQVSEDDESGTPISAFTNMTDENLEEILKIHQQEKQKEISQKYIPKGDLKEHQLKVFEILSNGGDLSEIAETPEKALQRPFEGFDMDDQQSQVDVRYTDLVHGKGLDHESAITIIDKEAKGGTLKDKAQKTFDDYRAAHMKYIDDMLMQQKKEKEFKDLNFKENKKTLTAKLKESGLKESVYKKVAAEYAKKNDNGDYYLIDKLREALESPEEHHELILHLADKDLFNQTFNIKASNETQKTIVRLASGASAKGNRQSSRPTNTEVSAPWLRDAENYNTSIKTK